LHCMDSLMLGAARFWGYMFISPTITLATLDINTFKFSSCLIKTYNSELINKLFHAVEKDYYNPEESLKQLLFLYLCPSPTTQPGLVDKQKQHIQTPPGQEEYVSKPLQCRLVLHIPRGARWKKWIGTHST
ncbi:hypothetical protein VP01_13603g1, partial [Puccinia sorghi]